MLGPSVDKFSSGSGFSSIRPSTSRSSLAGAPGVLVEEPGKAGDGAAEVSGSMTGVFQVGFGVPHVGSIVGVGWEHVLVLAGHRALQGKLEGEVQSSLVQPLLLEGEQGHLVAVVAPSQDDSKSFLLDTFNLSTLVLCEPTVEDWGCEL